MLIKKENVFMKGWKIWIVMPCIVLSALFQKSGHAVDNTPLWQGMDFDFSQPGARSKGIGSAFVGAADDATAAVTNPAGLVQLPEMQISLEGRTMVKKSFDVDWGAAKTGSINNEDETELSFVCFAMPLKLYKDFPINIAVYYSKLASMENKIQLPSFAFLPTGALNELPKMDYQEYSAQKELDIYEAGLSFGTGFLDGKLMVGGGVSALHLDIEGNYFSSGAIEIVEAPIQEKFSIDDNDIRPSFRGGILFSPINKLTLGASVRVMPRMRYETKYDTIITGYSKKGGSFNFEYDENLEKEQSLSIPDNYSLGLSYRITDKWTFFAEGRYIKYSDLMNDFDSTWRSAFDFGGTDEGRYDIDDVIEPHVGTEYVFMLKDSTPLAFRLGSYYEPAHGLEFDASSLDTKVVDSVEAANAMENLLDGGDDIWHFTVGLGTVIKNKYQIDAAADFTEGATKNTFILSTAYIF